MAKQTRKRLTEEQKAEIIQKIEGGQNKNALADEYGVSYQTINNTAKSGGVSGKIKDPFKPSSSPGATGKKLKNLFSDYPEISVAPSIDENFNVSVEVKGFKGVEFDFESTTPRDGVLCFDMSGNKPVFIVGKDQMMEILKKAKMV